MDEPRGDTRLFLNSHTHHCSLGGQVWWGWAEGFEPHVVGVGSHWRFII